MIKFAQGVIRYEYYNDNVLIEIFRKCLKDSTFNLIRLHDIVYTRLKSDCKDDELAMSDAVQLIANVFLPMLEINRPNYLRILSLLGMPQYNNNPVIQTILLEDFTPRFSSTNQAAA